MRTEAPAWFKTSFLDLPDDLAEARAAGKLGLMLLFSTEGCAHCKAFIERSLKDSAIGAAVRALRRHPPGDLRRLAVKDPQGRRLAVREFARREGAAFSPTQVFYDVDGERVHRVAGYQPPERFSTVPDYVVGGHYRALAYRDHLERRAAGRKAGDASNFPRAGR